jgi:hypothetical protein
MEKIILFTLLASFSNSFLFSQSASLVKGITPSNGSSMFGSSGYSGNKFVTVGSTLYFVKNFSKFWKTNGTPSGTVFIKNVGNTMN